MAAPRIYRSSDASAPVLTGTAGDLVNLIDKCLVSGYGALSAAGWTRQTGFAGNSTTRAVFRQGAGNQFYLDVDDRGATSVLTSASGREAAIRAYEAMTDVSTGTNPFPTVAQLAAATGNWRKSATADAQQRGWFVVADDRTFILGILDGDAAAVYKIYYFGDVYSLTTGDGYRTAISVRTNVNSALVAGTLEGTSLSTIFSSATTGWYMARIAAATGTSINVGLIGFGTTVPSLDAFPTANGMEYLPRFIVSDNTLPYMRGWLRGVYRVLQPVGVNDGDTFTGTGGLAGRTFVLAKQVGASSVGLAIETTAWDTSA